MKIVCLLTCLLGLATGAHAASDPLDVVLKCQVQKISEEPGFSYVPPTVGEEITIDTARPVVSSLRFSRRGMVPVLKPLERMVSDPSAPNIVYYKAESSPGEILTLMVGKFQAENESYHLAVIQSIYTSPLTGLTKIMGEIELSCVR